MTGRFVTLDALDGVGKATLVMGVARRLGGVAMDTPGPQLRALAPQVLAALGDAQVARCLFYAASVISQGKAARTRADAGETLVMDRYWPSTVAYARARGVEVDLDPLLPAVPWPDLSILVVIDEEERCRRLRSRGSMTVADAETLDPRFRATVLHHLTRLTDVVIDVTGLDPDAAAEQVARTVREALGLRRAP
jgi:dTMP kinase